MLASYPGPFVASAACQRAFAVLLLTLVPFCLSTSSGQERRGSVGGIEHLPSQRHYQRQAKRAPLGGADLRFAQAPPAGAQVQPADPNIVVPGVSNVLPQDGENRTGQPPEGRFPFGQIPLDLQRLALPKKAAELSQLPMADQATLRKFGQFVDPTQQAENVIYVVRGRPIVVPLRLAPVRIQIGDEEIANYQFVTPKELQLFGLEPGRTVLNLWFRDGENADRDTLLSYIVQVVDEYLTGSQNQLIFDRLGEEINTAIPQARVKLLLVGNRLVVSGTVPDQFTADKVLQIVTGAFGNRRQQTELITPDNLVVVAPTGDGFEQSPRQLADFLDTRNRRNNRNNANIVNLLRIVGEQQIQLRVTLAEVNRSALRAIGTDFQIGGTSGVSFASLLPATVAAPTNGGSFEIRRGDMSLAVSALRGLGMSRTLAEPNLVTVNGQTATFRAGVDLAVQNLGSSGGVALQGFGQVFAGVVLNFTPQIIDRDRIRIVVSAGASQPVGVSPNGPDISTRNVQTVVELREHQTMAIAGLIENELITNSQGVPLLGDVPYLRRLFSVDSISNADRELLIVITPSLVRPLEEHEVPSLPGETITEPGDLEFYLEGRIEGRRAYDYRSNARTSWDRMLAYHHCESCVLIGPSGHTDGPLPINRYPARTAVQHPGREFFDRVEPVVGRAGAEELPPAVRYEDP